MSDRPMVYVVEDDEAAAASLEALVSSHGIDVTVFGTAEAFLEAYVPGRRGCLVVDVRLPMMSGIELQERLIELGLDLPVIVISGHADQDMIARAKANGALELFEKPFSGFELFNVIRTALQ